MAECDSSHSSGPSDSPDPHSIWAAIRFLDLKIDAKTETLTNEVQKVLTHLERLTMAARPVPPTHHATQPAPDFGPPGFVRPTERVARPAAYFDRDLFCSLMATSHCVSTPPLCQFL